MGSKNFTISKSRFHIVHFPLIWNHKKILGIKQKNKKKEQNENSALRKIYYSVSRDLILASASFFAESLDGAPNK